MDLSSGMDQGTALGPFWASLGPQWWRIFISSGLFCSRQQQLDKNLKERDGV